MMIDKYTLYERSVQSPAQHVEWLRAAYQDLFSAAPRHLREDFCGTFWLCAEWIKADPSHSAVGLDLDPEPLAYGRQAHLRNLTPAQKRRLQILQQNVLTVTKPKADLIIAGNFSFCIFKERQILVDYFRKCLASLSPSPGGALVLEIAGGPGMIAPMRERKTVKLGSRKFTYIWDQKSFDPITHNASYSIHFESKPKTGKGSFVMRDAFTYDWRLWSITELRDALSEAGFQETAVYWETEHKGEGTGEYVRSEHGDNAYAWIAYVAGIRRDEHAKSGLSPEHVAGPATHRDSRKNWPISKKIKGN